MRPAIQNAIKVLALLAIFPVVVFYLAFWSIPGSAAATEDQDVIRNLSGGAEVNWTRMEVARWEEGRSFGVGGKQPAVEQQLRAKIGTVLKNAVLEVQVGLTDSIGDLIDGSPLGKTIKSRVNLWSVAEAIYYSSGRVRLKGAISLAEFLRPWVIENAVEPPEHPGATPYSGVVVDARGLGLVPCFSPVIKDSEQKVLYGGEVWKSVAIKTTPVQYVADAADPRASKRAGSNPWFLTPSYVSGCQVFLDNEQSEHFRRNLHRSIILGEGRLVVVVEPS
jgi:hypothetical protein